MSFNWTNYFTLSIKLLGYKTLFNRQILPLLFKYNCFSNQCYEARLRTSISRAYYAAFCSARNFLRDKDKDPNIPKDASAHAYVRYKFMNSTDIDRKAIGTNLDRLRDDRNDADYDDMVPAIDKMAEYAIMTCEDIMAKLSII